METANVIKRTCSLPRLRTLRESESSFVPGSKTNNFEHSFIWKQPAADAAGTPLRSRESGMPFLTRLKLAPWTRSARCYVVPNGIYCTDISILHPCPVLMAGLLGNRPLMFPFLSRRACLLFHPFLLPFVHDHRIESFFTSKELAGSYNNPEVPSHKFRNSKK
jgi:hypothetical protein